MALGGTIDGCGWICICDQELKDYAILEAKQ